MNFNKCPKYATLMSEAIICQGGECNEKNKEGWTPL